MIQTAHIRLGDQDIPYSLRRSTRRTIGFVINRNGLTVTAPQRVAVGDIEGALKEKSHWILSKLAAWAERPHQRELAYVTGETLPWLGGELKLQIEPRGIRTTLRRDGDRVLVTRKRVANCAGARSPAP